ncbi:MAG: branched-chain-amino-acid transaminase [Spirochaetales bacterium]|nr:branched-chain-amino-acid transaminase [Spirochaetales bacterium]
MVWLNGELKENNEAFVSVYDHGLLYGDGVFEGIRIYNGAVFKLEAHIERLYKSALSIALDIGLTPEQMRKAVLDTVAASGRSEGYIRLLVTRGPGSLGTDPDKCEKPTVAVIVDGISLYPEQHYRNGIKIITSATRRIGPDCLDPRVKSLNYLNNILAKIEAKQAGCSEAVMLNLQGRVAECTVDNIFMVKNGTVKTPPSVDGALEGITRETILELCEGNGIPWVQESLTRYDLYTADEMFLSGSGAELIPVVSVDGRTIGTGKPGGRTKELMGLFRGFVHSWGAGSNL